MSVIEARLQPYNTTQYLSLHGMSTSVQHGLLVLEWICQNIITNECRYARYGCSETNAFELHIQLHDNIKYDLNLKNFFLSFFKYDRKMK